MPIARPWLARKVAGEVGDSLRWEATVAAQPRARRGSSGRSGGLGAADGQRAGRCGQLDLDSITGFAMGRLGGGRRRRLHVSSHDTTTAPSQSRQDDLPRGSRALPTGRRLRGGVPHLPGPAIRGDAKPPIWRRREDVRKCFQHGFAGTFDFCAV